MTRRKNATDSKSLEDESTAESADSSAAVATEGNLGSAATAAKGKTEAIVRTKPISRDETGCKNDPEVDDALAGRSELMRRKAK